MKNNIIEAGDLPQGDKVYMKKDLFGWRIVQPIHNEDGTLNWFNILTGGTRNLAFTILMVVFVLSFFWVYNHDTAEMQKVVEEPCLYCSTEDLQSTLNERMAGRYEWKQRNKLPEINLSLLEESAGGNNAER